MQYPIDDNVINCLKSPIALIQIENQLILKKPLKGLHQKYIRPKGYNANIVKTDPLIECATPSG